VPGNEPLPQASAPNSAPARLTPRYRRFVADVALLADELALELTLEERCELEALEARLLALLELDEVFAARLLATDELELGVLLAFVTLLAALLVVLLDACDELIDDETRPELVALLDPVAVLLVPVPADPPPPPPQEATKNRAAASMLLRQCECMTSTS